MTYGATVIPAANQKMSVSPLCLNSIIQWHKVSTWGSSVPAAPVSQWAKLTDFHDGLWSVEWEGVSLTFILGASTLCINIESRLIPRERERESVCVDVDQNRPFSPVQIVWQHNSSCVLTAMWSLQWVGAGGDSGSYHLCDSSTIFIRF